ncbi:MAG TPA: twin-arginine translocation signal domain-containing protein, partial [Blastocatellia bacterium]|nr:twin-arginine translocation signal domain-containing protein [Blastocatellia bacterium]
MSVVDQPIKGSPLISRRRFFQTAAAGAAGAALGLNSVRQVSAQDESLGQITLDALLISYFSASIGSTGIPLWSLSGRYSNTIRIRVQESPELVLKPKPTADDSFIFAGHEIELSRSRGLKNGLIMRHKGFADTKFGFGRDEDVHTREDTVFFSIFRPRIELVGN